jgi:hypothetical protein
MDLAMLWLFHRLELSVGPPILTAGALSFVVIFGSKLKFSLEFVCLPSVEYDTSSVILILLLDYFT